MLGTDYPYAAGDTKPLEKLRKAGLENEQNIFGENAVRLLGLN
jgi:predicted TIM-barrel fold metal-dependent hydrolase